MTKTDALSRRKLLGRIGLLAVAGYTVPALTTLSMAQAEGGPSGGGGDNSSHDGNDSSNDSSHDNSHDDNSNDNSSNDDNTPSGAPSSAPGNTPNTGGPVTDSGADPALVKATCGAQNLNDPTYLQCLVANGF